MKFYLLLCWFFGFCVILFQTAEPVALNNITRFLTSETARPTTSFYLYTLLGIYLFVTLGTFFFQIIQFIVFETWKSHLIYRQTMVLYQKVLGFDSDFLKNTEPEKIVKRIERDVLLCVAFRATLLNTLPIAIPGILISGWMMFYGSFPFLEQYGIASQAGNRALALLIILLSPLQFLFMAFNKIFMRTEQTEAKCVEEGYAVCSEALHGITDLRASFAFPFALARIGEALRNVCRMRIKIQKMYVTFPLIDKIIVSVTQVLILGVAAGYICGGKLTFADYMGFTVLCTIFNFHAAELVSILLQMQYSRPARQRIEELRNHPEIYVQGKYEFDWKFEENFKINVRDLSYEVEGHKILDGLNVEFPLGSRTALIGPSGSGKTTFIQILARQILPTKGTVSIGGENIEQIPFEFFTQKVAYIPQTPFLFKGTIRENILMGRPIYLTAEEWLELVENVGLAEDLQLKAPKEKNRKLAILKGLDFSLKTGNQGVSGGQTAKIALARALVGEPEILLLDEINASLDENSQKQITDFLLKKCTGKTILFICHRLNVLHNFERVLILENGKYIRSRNYEKKAD